jgi:hypothetical protein
MKKIILITLLGHITCNGSEKFPNFSIGKFITLKKKPQPNDSSKRQSLVPKNNYSSFIYNAPLKKKEPTFLEDASSTKSKPLEIPTSKNVISYSPSFARSAPNMISTQPPLIKEDPSKGHARNRSRSHNLLELDQKPPTNTNATEELFSSSNSTSKNTPVCSRTKAARPMQKQKEEEDPLSTLRIHNKNKELKEKERELLELLSSTEIKLLTIQTFFKKNNIEKFTEENSQDNEFAEEFINIKKETESLVEEQKKLIKEKEQLSKKLNGIQNACAFIERLSESKEEVKKQQATEFAKQTKPKNPDKEKN